MAAFSPDSRKIAFVSNRDGNNEIHVMNADDTNPTNVTESLAFDSDPDWGRQAVSPLVLKHKKHKH